MPIDPIAAEVAKVDFPQRPPRHVGGQEKVFNAMANNFLVTQLPAGNMFHYDTIRYKSPENLRVRKDKEGTPIAVDPFDVRKSIAHKLIHSLQVDNPTIFKPGSNGAYDGRKNLYLVYQPKMAPSGATFQVSLPPRPGRQPHPLDDFIVTIKYANSVDTKALQRFVKGGAIADGQQRRQAHINAATAVMFVNEMLRTVPIQSDKWINAGRTFLSTERSRQRNLPESGLVLVSGFFMSVRPCLSGIVVNVDSAVGVMYPPIPLMTVIQSITGLRDMRRLRARDFLGSREAMELFRYLKGIRVVVNVGRCPENGRKITGLARGARDYDFKDGNNETITIQEHYHRTYNHRLIHPEVFCVQVSSSKERPIAYPIEICTIVGGQLFKKAIPPEVTRQMLQFGPNNPAQRLKDIKDGFEMLDFNTAVRSNGLRVERDLLNVTGRRIDTPQLWFRQRDGRELALKPPPTSQYTLPGKAFMKPAQVKAWGVLTLFDPRDRDYREVADRFARQLYSVLQGLGMKPEQPQFREASITSDVPAALTGIAGQLPKDPAGRPLIIAILPPVAAEARHAIKWWGDTQTGVPTQCVRIDKIRGVKDDYLHNLALKINTRLGGINHYIDRAAVPWGSRNAMVVGADVSHPPVGDSSQPSVSAMCASVDPPLSKYVATSRVQTRRNESIEDFQEMLMYLLEGFRHARDVPEQERQKVERRDWLTRIWPSIIVIYRDGVGEGQYAAVTDAEVAAAKAAVQAVKERHNEPDAPPCAISYIIVSKKHHQRFFPEARDADKKGNCLPGSVFDDVVAHPTLFDFYLQSQAAIIGTARPAHYILTYDENSFSVDHVASGGPSYSLQDWQQAYTPLHHKHQNVMYFI
ncbi:Piwi-domain-containing protein [Auricularia subglabra TFB-10046 SS5]|nr:Piwi-domain-containing protein [Auricularia subglabra TFB-10046 SS5]